MSNLLLPLGALVYVLFCVSRVGWGYGEFLREANTGRGLRMPGSKWMKLYLQFALPLLILLVFLQGLIA